VTVFGLIFTPAFYVLSRWFATRGRRRAAAVLPAPGPAE
jgi:hypothetical protein